MNTVELIKHRTGFWQVKNKPSEEELQEYYSSIYFQTSKGAYEQVYSPEELTALKNSNAIKYELTQRYYKKTTGRLLDIGCGKGFTLDYFFERGWEVLGLDYSIDGVNKQNPNMKSRVTQGDIYASIKKLKFDKESFDVIAVLNVLEHVTAPEELLNSLHNLLSANGMLIIVVPNDFSVLQEALFASGKITRKFWIRYPDHLNYFEKESLIRLCEEEGFRFATCLADFPIDYFLANPDSNYVEDPSKGKNAHKARVWLDNLNFCISPDKTIKLYEALAELGSGRQIAAYFTKS